MTDKDIIKALECCVKNNNCEGCPLDYLTFSSQCASELAVKSLDLINRQQEELADERAKIEICAETISRQDAYIKRLKKDKYKLQKALNQSEDYRVMAKSEAFKEFAERLKEKAHTQPIFDTYCGNKYMGDVSKVYVADIDNLVKEMVGEE